MRSRSRWDRLRPVSRPGRQRTDVPSPQHESDVDVDSGAGDLSSAGGNRAALSKIDGTWVGRRPRPSMWVGIPAGDYVRVLRTRVATSASSNEVAIPAVGTRDQDRGDRGSGSSRSLNASTTLNVRRSPSRKDAPQLTERLDRTVAAAVPISRLPIRTCAATRRRPPRLGRFRQMNIVAGPPPNVDSPSRRCRPS